MEARDCLNRALTLLNPGRDDDLAFRFGQDPGIAAMVYLAIVLWPMGDVERAVSLVHDAEARISSLAHIGTQAYGIAHAEVFRPKTTEYLNLFSLTRTARLPFHSEGFVLDVIPSYTDAQPETPTAQEIHLGRLLSDDAGLTLRRDQNSGGKPDGLSDRGQKAKGDKGLVERILLIIKRDPAISGSCAEDVIGDFNVCESEVFRRLRPIADLRGVCPNIK